MKILFFLFFTLALSSPIFTQTERGVKNFRIEQKIALVIGNTNYDNSIGKLTNPVNDANDMASSLQRLGFTLIGGKAQMDVNRRRMLALIRDFGQQIRQGGIGFFYFSGHGVQVNKENYIIPITDALVYEDDAETEAVKVDMVAKEMELAGNRLNILVLDACRNNGLQKRTRNTDKGLTEPARKPEGTFIAFSAGDGQTASDGTGKNGLFTQELLKNLEKPNLRLDDVFRTTRSEVKRLSDGKQVPILVDSTSQAITLKPDENNSASLETKSSSAEKGNSGSFQPDKTKITEVEMYYNNGVAFHQKSEYSKAIAEFTKAINLDPNYEPAYHYRGLSISCKNEYILSIIDFTKSIELNPGNTYSYIYRGNMFVMLKDQDKAILDYSKAIELSPKDTYAYISRGAAYAYKHDYELAKADFDQAISINPNYAPAWEKRGWLHNLKSEYDLAIADYNKYLQLQPMDIWAYDSRGWSYLNKRNFDLALTDFNKAIQLNPQNSAAYGNRGALYANKQKYDLAISDYSKALEFASSGKARIYRNRAIAYDASGQRDLAEADRRKAEELENSAQ